MGVDPIDPAEDTPVERTPVERTLIEVAPVEVNSERIAFVGLAIFVVATLVLLPFYGWLGDHGHRIWLWTSIAGVGVGLFGYVLSRRHKNVGRTK